jgi:hypothetical protein
VAIWTSGKTLPSGFYLIDNGFFAYPRYEICFPKEEIHFSKKKERTFSGVPNELLTLKLKLEINHHLYEDLDDTANINIRIGIWEIDEKGEKRSLVANCSCDLRQWTKTIIGGHAEYYWHPSLRNIQFYTDKVYKMELLLDAESPPKHITKLDEEITLSGGGNEFSIMPTCCVSSLYSSFGVNASLLGRGSLFENRVH